MNVSPSGTTLFQPVQNDRIASKELSQNDFMKLLIEQLKNQNPLKPTDSNSMLQQMSSISTVQAMNGMQDSFKQLKVDQQLSLGQSLIGKSIEITNPADGSLTTGSVEKVTVDHDTSTKLDTVSVSIRGTKYPLSGLVSVVPTPIP